MDEEESQPAAALSFDDAAAQDKEQELGEKEVEATDMQLENRKHDTTNDIDETDNGLSGYVESEAGADVSGVSGEEEIPPEADERRNTSPEAEEVILEQQGSAGVCQDSDGERPAESTDNELRDVSLDSRRRSSGNPEEDPDETRLFDAALNRPRFRTIASVLARASGASNDGEHTAAATAAAEQILASIEERTEHMLLLSNRIVQKLHSRVRSGARVTSGDSKPRIRFGSVPTIVFEGEQSMYGQWQLKEEEAEDAAVQAVRHIAALALSSVTAERPPQEDRGGSEGDEESSEIRANSPDHEAVGDGSREGGASRPEADEDEECLAESAGRGSRVMSAADSTGRESWCWNGTETRDPTEQPDASEPGERSGESKCRGERPEKNASQEEDLASMSDERAAKEFDLWFGADRRLAADRGASPLSTARDRTHRSTGPLMEGTVPIPYDTARRGFEPEKSLGAEAGVAAKAAAARELITLSLKQEKLWRMFGRDTHAGRLLHQLYKTKTSMSASSEIVYPIPKSIKDLRGNPNFQILKPTPSSFAAANAARRAHAPRPKVAVPRVGRRPVPCGYQGKTTGQPKDLLFGGGAPGSAIPPAGRKSLARIAVEAEQQRKEILAEARAAAAHAAAANKLGRTRERAKQSLQDSFSLGECRALPPAARLPGLPKAMQIELLNSNSDETEGTAVPGAGRRSGSCPKDVRFLGKKGGRIDPQTGLTAEQRKLYLRTVEEINSRRERLEKLREMMPDEVLAAAVGAADSLGSINGRGRSEIPSGVGKEHSLVLQIARSRHARRKVQENLQQETRLQREIDDRLKDLKTLASISEAQLLQQG